MSKEWRFYCFILGLMLFLIWSFTLFIIDTLPKMSFGLGCLITGIWIINMVFKEMDKELEVKE